MVQDECAREGISRLSNTTVTVPSGAVSRTVRTILNRFDLANGPTFARSSTSHAAPSPSSDLTRPWIIGIHSG
jgi:hypothetical protein